MTNKQALEQLLYYATLDDSGFEPYMKDYAKTISKDLEVLEILKKYYKSDGWSNGGVIEFWGMSDAQLKKIREWLENEIH